MRPSFDSGTLSLYLAVNRAVQRNGGCRGPYVLFGKGFRAPPLRALRPMLMEAGKEGQAPLTRFGAALLHRSLRNRIPQFLDLRRRRNHLQGFLPGERLKEDHPQSLEICDCHPKLHKEMIISRGEDLMNKIRIIFLRR
ncbi:hypothetical protein Nepgr_028693 [Nepenthes gracilis]|uniref:Uncharacterized protein n=1 Tax=Nepenthes gracilis TaxID=150966 RepID=A0AAD3Y470_NEPGR|nr:hypothetical protein Nepgr_028693 [Nepenthes gracilis]